MTQIWVFPGQGSQARGMGQALFDAYPEVVAQADAVLGTSIRTLCLEDPQGRLGQTRFTQPAIYTVNALACRARLEQTGREPDFVAGHSLGEFNALLAAGAFDFEVGLRLVCKRGELMGQVEGSGMAAVVGIAADRLVEVLATSGADRVDLANLNAPDQTVIAGLVSDLEQATPALERAGGRVFLLPVSAAFHSRYMASVRTAFAGFLGGFDFSPLLIPTLCNVSGLPYADEAIAENLIAQIDSPVRWTDILGYLLRETDPQFEEVGPGRVLTGLLARFRTAG